VNHGFPPALHPLIRAIEEHIYSRPESVLGHLRELLARCNGDAQLCYAYQQLGFAHLRLSEYRMSKIFYEQALALEPNDFYILANLAHALYELGDKARGVEYGRRALQSKDQSVAGKGEFKMGAENAGRLNLISFSLYGRKPKYCETAVLNCSAAKAYLPNFTCRFYVDETVPVDVLRRLKELSAEIVFVGGRAASFPGTFWRFLALDDEGANFVLVRDADSIIEAREVHCVNEWIASQKPFHIIRDDCCHTELIQAGLFAAKSGILNKIEERIANFVASDTNLPIGRFSDQVFLRKCVWPVVRDHALTHDSVYSYGSEVRDIPAAVAGTPGVRNHFIGATFASRGVQLSMQQSLPDTAFYVLRITDGDGRLVCEYEMDRVNQNQLEIFLPPPYIARMETRSWAGEIYSENRQTHERTLITRLFS